MLRIPGTEEAVGFYFALAEGKRCSALPYRSHALKGFELSFAGKLVQQGLERCVPEKIFLKNANRAFLASKRAQRQEYKQALGAFAAPALSGFVGARKRFVSFVTAQKIREIFWIP